MTVFSRIPSLKDVTPAAARSDAPWTSIDSEHASRERVSAEFEAELAPVLGSAMQLALAMRLDRQDAEDAVQEAALRAWRHRGTRRAGSAMRPWFLAIVANQCRDSRMARWRSVLRVGEPPMTSGASPDDRAGALDASTALSKLPYDMRLAVALRYYLDLPFDEIGPACGCSLEAARSRVRRGLAALEAMLSVPESS
jgi:RNA polymerase sigma-70 factor (ECF subfamily)